MDAKVSRKASKPQSAEDLIALLREERGERGKGGRRLVTFLIENANAAAMLTSAEVAERCDVHASSVVRLAQSLGFSGFRELQSLFQQKFSTSRANGGMQHDIPFGTEAPHAPLRLRLIAESGKSFNESTESEALKYCELNPSVSMKPDFFLPHAVDPQDLSDLIAATDKGYDGLILVAREHAAINSAVRHLSSRNVPVVCLTTDLPSSGRTVYVGSDQYASGASAGWFCGRMARQAGSGRVLFVYSVPFRCQLDREQGFRQVLRSEFQHLTIDERVASNESPDVIYDAVRRYVSKHGPPTAIYNASGANSGIGRALEDEGLGGKTIFVGHELNVNSRLLLERGTMDLSIGHDLSAEFSLSVDSIRTALSGRQPIKRLTPSHLYMRYNCSIT